jgi:hypothetical protein
MKAPSAQEPAPTTTRQHPPPKIRPATIPIEQISEHSDSEIEEVDHNQRWRQPSRPHSSAKTPLSEELKEVQWPRRFNPTVMPQFDGESNPKEFLLKYEATIEAIGRGTTCKFKALVLTLRGQAQRWYTNLPSGTILSWKQLRSELIVNFQTVRNDKVTSSDFHNNKQGRLTL